MSCSAREGLSICCFVLWFYVTTPLSGAMRRLCSVTASFSGVPIIFHDSSIYPNGIKLHRYSICNNAAICYKLITNCGACHHAICNNSAICNKHFKLGLSQDLLFVALWFILRGDLFYVLTCVFCSCVFSVHLALRLSRLGRRELILVLFVRLFDLRLFGFVCFLFLLVFGKACGLLLWHSLDS